MAREKPPSFPFYAKDWLSDTRELGTYGRGVLIDMIALCWENGSISDNPTVVATAVGASPKQVHQLWEILLPKFARDSSAPGRLVNRRLEVERAGQVAYREEQSVKGKASAAKRARTAAQQRFNRGSTVVQPEAQPESNLPFASCVVQLDPPISPASGGGVLAIVEPQPKRRKRGPKATHPDAPAVLDAINAARPRCIPGAATLSPTAENMRHISDRLVGGATLAQCLHVVAVCEAETRGDPSTGIYFNAVTPFRKDGFAMKVARAATAPPPRPVAPVKYEPRGNPDSARPIEDLIARQGVK